MAGEKSSFGRRLLKRVIKGKKSQGPDDTLEANSRGLDAPVVTQRLHVSTPPLESMSATAAIYAKPPSAEETDERLERFGLFRMQNPRCSPINTPDRRYQVDIVAIHGITGDAYNTWKSPSGGLWLQDFLPEDLPGARVYSYGYDADVFFTKSTGNVETFARTLLENLKQEVSDDGHTRPIIFVCHSMGGLVVKQAIVTSILKAGNYGIIKERTYGIVFLGTPHRGSNQTAFPSLLANIANTGTPVLSRFIGKSRADLINVLKRDAGDLEKLSYQFADQLAVIKIASFIELDITPPASTRIVDGVTGIINCAGERVIDMQGCDHRSICRFAQRSNNYRLILGILKEWASAACGQIDVSKKNQAQQYIDEVVEECQDSLMFPSYDWRKMELHGRALQGSCAWVFDHPVFQAWLDKPQGPLWIKGKPGSGKSTLMEILVEDFEKSSKHPNIVPLHFFFVRFGYSKGSIRSSPQGLYRTLLFQLLEKVPEATTEFQEYCSQRIRSCKRRGTVFEWDQNDTDIIRQHLNVAFGRLAKTDKSIRVFVDAIDEVNPRESEDVALYLDQLDRRLRGMGLDFRLCISSRHLPINTVSEKHNIVLERENKRDIENYVRNQFSSRNITLRESLTDSRQLQILENKIISYSDGMFFWVWSKVPDVIKALNYYPDNIEIAEKALEEVPGELDMIYADMLTNLIVPTDRSDAYSLLNWASRTPDPMHMGRLVQEVRFSDAYSLPSVGTLEEFLKINTRISRFSGGLLEALHALEESVALQDAIVKFMHPSVRSYLQNHGLVMIRRLLSWRDPVSVNGMLSDDDNDWLPDWFSHPTMGDRMGEDNILTIMHPCIVERRPEFPSSATQNINTLSRHISDPDYQRIWEIWMTKWETHLKPHLQGRAPGKPRIKVAILDTGISIGNRETWGFRDRMKEFRNFKGNPVSGPRDTDGHGTRTTSIILKLAPSVDIYMARVSESYLRRPSLDTIIKALLWAKMHHVDIICLSIMPLGVDLVQNRKARKQLTRVLEAASNNGIVVFTSAGSNWPNTINNCIPVWSADGHGQVPYIPPPPECYNNFAFISDGVHTENSETPTNSSAIAVAAGIASMLFAFARNNAEKLPDDVKTLLQDKSSRVKWLRTVFQFMSSSRDAFDYVVPWKLFNDRDSTEQILDKLMNIIKSGAINQSASPPPSTSFPTFDF
ncbi:hypothetical protein PG984_016579 [Apiospora sp. TS-2023a]